MNQMTAAQKNARGRRWMVLAICGVITGAVMLLWQRGFLQGMENSAQDWQMRLGRKTPLDDRLVFIGIDKPMYSADFSDEELRAEPVLRDLQKSFPWSRAVWARLIERLAGAGAKVIAFDLVFATPGEGDAGFRAALDKYRDRVVLGYNISGNAMDRGDTIELQFPNEELVGAGETNSPVEDSRLGYVNIWPEADGVLRRAAYHKNGHQVGDVLPAEMVLESLTSRMMEKAGEAGRVPAGFESRFFRYTAPPGQDFRPIPVGMVLSPKMWESNYKDFFKDKIVLIGPAAEIFQDFHATPFKPGEMAGPEIHLQILNAALHQEFLRPPSPVARLLIILFSGLLAGLLCRFVLQPLKRLGIILALAGAYWLFVFGIFIRLPHTSAIPFMFPPTLVMVISGLVFLAYDFVLERLERMKLRHTMGLYFSPRVMEAVLADPGSMEPRRAEVVLLLTDLRNSTPLAELLGPQGMFDLLNRVFEVETAAIMGEEGNLEHFLGDQFLSYWGAPQKQPDAAERAFRAAQKLIRSMEELRVTLPPETAKLFGYGVALHSGSVLVGNKGSALRLDYGLVGDVVNEAARVEALTKYYGVKLLVTRDAFAQLDPQLTRRLVDRIIVKGKSEPVEIFEAENVCTIADFGALCQRYQAAYDEYHLGHFSEAQKLFDVLVRDFSDGPSKALSRRCGELMARPPAGWRGIWKMDAK